MRKTTLAKVIGENICNHYRCRLSSTGSALIPHIRAGIQQKPIPLQSLRLNRNDLASAMISPSKSPTRTNTKRSMNATQPKNPLHSITLEKLLNELVAFYGWDSLGRQIDIRCFTHDPSVTSSLKFLRRTPWARERVEALYIDTAAKASDPPNLSEPESTRIHRPR